MPAPKKYRFPVVALKLQFPFFKLILGIGFFLFCTNLSAQSDSLQQALQKAKGGQRIEILLKLSKITRHTSPKKAILQAREALSISKRLEKEELQSESMEQLGFLYDMVDQHATSLEYYLSALKMERRHGHPLAEADILHNLGRFYANQGSHAKALDYYFQALRIRQEKGDKTGTATTMSYIGDTYSHRQEPEQAISFYKQAVELGKETQNQRVMSISGVKVAINLHNSGHFEEASPYFDLALGAAEKMNSIHAQAGIMLAMSDAYKKEQYFKKALALNQKLLQIAKSSNNKILLARSYENLAGIHTEQDDLKLANQYLLQSITHYEAVGVPALPVVEKLMQNYLQQDNPSKAVEIGETVLKQTAGSENLQQRGSLFKMLASAYEKQGNYQKALESQNQLAEINQQIYSKEKSEQIAEMQARYETQQKEKEILLLEEKQEKALLLRNVLIGGIVVFILIGFLVYNRQRLKIHKNKTDLENTKLKEKQFQQDLEFKNKQLTTHSLHLVQKNEVLKELKQRIAELQSTVSGKTDSNLRSIGQLVDYSFNLDKDWEEFKHYFEEIHTGFFDSLKSRFPELTSNELRLSALLKLNLTSKEIATILSIAPDSVKTARYRLRKKFGLETDDNLVDFLQQIDKEASS